MKAKTNTSTYASTQAGTCEQSQKNTLTGTLIGTIAIILWGLLALFSKVADAFPPFQLLAMCFSIAILFMCLKWIIYKDSLANLIKQPLSAWVIGCAGLFLYHACYFFALANAPVLEVSLIAYLWPFLIVLFSALLPGEHLYIKHILGAAVSLFGCWVLLGGADSSFNTEYLFGYLLAAACSLIWASYSVCSRMVKSVPTDAVGLFCAVCAVLGWIFHAALESFYTPADYIQWFGVVGLGLGPLGLAFFAWDYGVKRGNIQLLGVLSYATPLISTAMLIIFGDIKASSAIYFACAAIVSGALIASIGWSKVFVILKIRR